MNRRLQGCEIKAYDREFTTDGLKPSPEIRPKSGNAAPLSQLAGFSGGRELASAAQRSFHSTSTGRTSRRDCIERKAYRLQRFRSAYGKIDVPGGEQGFPLMENVLKLQHGKKKEFDAIRDTST
jgi:hypothetical protein